MLTSNNCKRSHNDGIKRFHNDVTKKQFFHMKLTMKSKNAAICCK